MTQINSELARCYAESIRPFAVVFNFVFFFLILLNDFSLVKRFFCAVFGMDRVCAGALAFGAIDLTFAIVRSYSSSIYRVYMT